MKVLILTEKKVGSGHYHAALALKEVFQRDYASLVDVKVLEGLRSVHPFLEWSVVQSYFLALRLCPQLWGFTYHRAKSPPLIQKYGFALKLASLIEEERPDMVLCTHPACVAALSYLKQKTNKLSQRKTARNSFRLTYVATDYGCHPFCIHPYVDDYFVAYPAIKTKLMDQFQIPKHKIHDYGIPLLQKYERKSRPSRSPHSPAAAPHVLLLGGGSGVGPLKKIVHILLPYVPSLQLTVVCGRNQKLFQNIKKYRQDKLKVLPYVQDMKRLMEEADVILTKPGGMTISEALACGKPLLLFDPIPGQEDANRMYVQHEQLGDCIEQLQELPAKLFHLSDPQQKRLLQKQIRDTHPQNSAHKIVHKLMEKKKNVFKQKDRRSIPFGERPVSKGSQLEIGGDS